jgi:alcohol dehydrogenase, propanol-preferring
MFNPAAACALPAAFLAVNAIPSSRVNRPQRYCFALPGAQSAQAAAPWLCAGLIGYRALRLAGDDAKRLGIYGFGAAAHLVAQVAVAQGREVLAFTREADAAAQDFARQLGAAWAGPSSARPPEPLDAALIFAPVGALVPAALAATAKGGCVVCGGIHMSAIPAFAYELLWGERVLRSVANLTRADGESFMRLAGSIKLRMATRVFPLQDADAALAALREGRLEGAAVLQP